MGIAANLKENQAKGANLDLEREFRKNLKGTNPETFARSENPTLRRLSMKPEAMKAFTHRRDSYFDGARRRSTLRRLSSVNKGSVNEGFEEDSAIAGSDENYSTSRNSQIVEFVEESEEEELDREDIHCLVELPLILLVTNHYFNAIVNEFC